MEKFHFTVIVLVNYVAFASSLFHMRCWQTMQFPSFVEEYKNLPSFRRICLDMWVVFMHVYIKLWLVIYFVSLVFFLRNISILSTKATHDEKCSTIKCRKKQQQQQKHQPDKFITYLHMNEHIQVFRVINLFFSSIQSFRGNWWFSILSSILSLYHLNNIRWDEIEGGDEESSSTSFLPFQ